MFVLKVISFSSLVLPEKAKELIHALASLDTPVFLVGGFIRDMLIDLVSFDLDFVVVDKDPENLAKSLSENFGGHSFLLHDETKTTRLVLSDQSCSGYTFDFTGVSKQDLEKDFLRRDFTINALAVNLKEPNILIDKFSGQKDLKEKKIRSVTPENLLDDPLRFLRAFRFASLINGEIDNDTLIFIKINLEHFNNTVASERILNELWKLFDNDNSCKYISQMADIGLLEKIFPELTPTRKVTPNIYHHLWLFDHSIEMIKIFEESFCKIPKQAKDDLNKPFGALKSPVKKSVAKLASLLHDIGKPDTWEIKQGDGFEKHTFYGHDKLGSKKIEEISKRLKFSNSISETLSKLVRYHLRPFQLSQPGAEITEKALYRFFRDVENDTTLLLMLALSDLYATCGPKVTKEDLANGEKLILFLFDKYFEYKTKKEEKTKKPKLLDGNEIMKLTGLKPSCQLGDLIKNLDELIATGEITTKEDAVKWALEHKI